MSGRNLWFFSSIAGVFGCIALLGFLTTLLSYKPWGVPDSRRGDYDAKLNNIKLADLAKEGKAPVPLPKVKAGLTSRILEEGIAGDKILQEFRIENIGSAPLTLSVENPSTKDLQWNLSTKQIAPGDSASLNLGWQSNNHEAVQFRSIRFQTNDPLKPLLTFYVEARLMRPIVMPASIPVGGIESGEPFEQMFYVASETNEAFTVASADASISGFAWSAQPAPKDNLPYELRQSKAVFLVKIEGIKAAYGSFSEQIKFELLLDDQLIERTSTLTGKVKSAISFVHPELHMTDGLSLGTISSEQEKSFGVSVLQRGSAPRELEVLSHEPKELAVELKPSESVPGAYRLGIVIPVGTETVIFNRASQHGFVEVGDPKDPDYSSWFPIYGVVVGAEL